MRSNTLEFPLVSRESRIPQRPRIPNWKSWTMTTTLILDRGGRDWTLRDNKKSNCPRVTLQRPEGMEKAISLTFWPALVKMTQSGGKIEKGAPLLPISVTWHKMAALLPHCLSQNSARGGNKEAVGSTVDLNFTWRHCPHCLCLKVVLWPRQWT